MRTRRGRAYRARWRRRGRHCTATGGSHWSAGWLVLTGSSGAGRRWWWWSGRGGQGARLARSTPGSRRQLGLEAVAALLYARGHGQVRASRSCGYQWGAVDGGMGAGRREESNAASRNRRPIPGGRQTEAGWTADAPRPAQATRHKCNTGNPARLGEGPSVPHPFPRPSVMLLSLRSLAVPLRCTASSHLRSFTSTKPTRSMSPAPPAPPPAGKDEERRKASGFPYWLDVQTRWSDNDQYGHVK